MTASSPIPSGKKAGDIAGVRFIGDLPGCYVLSSRENFGDDQAKVFACRARSISPRRAVVQAPVRGHKGEPVALRFDDVGLLRGTVARPTPDGFIADLLVSEAEQAALALRIDWLKRK